MSDTEITAAEDTPLVSFTDFMQLDIRIGTITLAEVVPEADKLLRLEVDFGDFSRQIVSGIREFVAEPAALVGTQAPFVVNLESRTIKGYESQGMIMAVGDNEVFTFLRPEQPVAAGTNVR